MLRAHELKPHLIRTCKVSRDLSVDEKTSIHARERTHLLLSAAARTSRAAHAPDYERHGVPDLYAALNVSDRRGRRCVQRKPHGS